MNDIETIKPLATIDRYVYTYKNPYLGKQTLNKDYLEEGYCVYGGSYIENLERGAKATLVKILESMRQTIEVNEPFKVKLRRENMTPVSKHNPQPTFYGYVLEYSEREREFDFRIASLAPNSPIKNLVDEIFELFEIVEKGDFDKPIGEIMHDLYIKYKE